MHSVLHTRTKHHHAETHYTQIYNKHSFNKLDVTYHPNKHNWLEKTKKHYFKEKNQIQTKFEMQRREFWERQFTVFPVHFTGTYR